MEFEYELRLSYYENILNDEIFILFDLQTTKIFEHYIYKINAEVIPNLPDKEIVIDIEGLSAPILDLSHSGESSFRYNLYNFKFTAYTLKILRNGKTDSVYLLRFSKNKISTVKKSKKSSVKLITI